MNMDDILNWKKDTCLTSSTERRIPVWRPKLKEGYLFDVKGASSHGEETDCVGDEVAAQLLADTAVVSVNKLQHDSKTRHNILKLIQQFNIWRIVSTNPEWSKYLISGGGSHPHP